LERGDAAHSTAVAANVAHAHDQRRTRERDRDCAERGPKGLDHPGRPRDADQRDDDLVADRAADREPAEKPGARAPSPDAGTVGEDVGVG
jgi:hypothetical protein